MANKQPPVLKFRPVDPLGDYYDNGTELYSVARLVEDSKDLPVFEVPLASLNLDDLIWEDLNLWAAAFHVHRVMEADLSHPIILDWDGCIADGRHRIIKALCEGKKTIKAVRITWKMTPDRKTKENKQ